MSKSLSARPAPPDVAALAASQVIALLFVAPGGHVRSELAAIVMSPLSFWLKRFVKVAAEAVAGSSAQARIASSARRRERYAGMARCSTAIGHT